jgi:hypothetical protein
VNTEQLHDAIGMLPADLIAPVDALRCAPQKRKPLWPRYAAAAACLAVLLWGSVAVLDRMGLSTNSAVQMESMLDSSAVSGLGQQKAEAVPTEARNPAGIPSSTVCDCAPPAAVEEGAPKEPAGDDYPMEPGGDPVVPDTFYVGGSAGYSPAPGHKEGMEYPYSTVIRSREALDTWYAEHRDYYDIDSFEAGYAHLDADYFRNHDLLLVMLEEEYGYVYQEPYYLKTPETGKWELTFTAHYQQEERIEVAMQWLYFIETEKGLIGEADTIEILPEPHAVPEDGYVEAHTIPTGGK